MVTGPEVQRRSNKRCLKEEDICGELKIVKMCFLHLKLELQFKLENILTTQFRRHNDSDI